MGVEGQLKGERTVQGTQVGARRVDKDSTDYASLENPGQGAGVY